MATDFAFRPDEVVVRSGEPLNLVLENRGRLFHDLSFDTIDLVLVADPGRSDVSSLVVEVPGRYRFICTVRGHVEAGMSGTLVVE